MTIDNETEAEILNRIMNSMEEINLDEVTNNLKKRRIEDIADLQSKSKPLHELIVTEYFTVDEVIGQSYATSFTPESEMRFGGISPVYRGGYTSELILQVTPDNNEAAIRTLTFKGISSVQRGDYISAQIARYQEKNVGWVENEEGNRVGGLFYIDREFKPEESVIELSLLTEERCILRSDRAINYNTFFRK